MPTTTESLSILISFLKRRICKIHCCVIRSNVYNIKHKKIRKDGHCMEYISVSEAAKKWEISERRIQKLCKENRIPGVERISRIWLIPWGTRAVLQSGRLPSRVGRWCCRRLRGIQEPEKPAECSRGRRLHCQYFSRCLYRGRG